MFSFTTKVSVPSQARVRAMEEESEKLRQLQSEVAFHDQLFDNFIQMMVNWLFDKVTHIVVNL